MPPASVVATLASAVSTAGAIWVASWVALVVHEGGHALVGRGLGVRLWGLRLGAGPGWHGTWRGVRLDLGLVPAGGAVCWRDEDVGQLGYTELASGRPGFVWRAGSWRAVAITAAGGLANLVGVGLALTLARRAGGAGHPEALWWWLVFAAGQLAGVVNLLPVGRLDGGRLRSQLRARGRTVGSTARAEGPRVRA